MAVDWSQLPPCLPCVVCKNVGHVVRDGLNYPCERCNGSGLRFCELPTVRKEYARLRALIGLERGIAEKDLDEMVQRRVQRAERVMGDLPQAIWFDALYYMARDWGLLDKWWEIAKFGRK